MQLLIQLVTPLISEVDTFALMWAQYITETGLPRFNLGTYFSTIIEGIFFSFGVNLDLVFVYLHEINYYSFSLHC